MIVAIYLIGLFFLYLYLRSVEKRYESLYVIAYNFVIVALIFLLNSLNGSDGGSFWEALVTSIYRAPEAMTFQGDTDGISPQGVFVMFTASVLTLGAVVYLFFYQAIMRCIIRLRIIKSKEVYVICGFKDDAQALINDIIKDAPRNPIVFIDEEIQESPEEIDEQPIRGALLVGKDFISKLNKKKQYTFVLLPTFNNNNITLLKKLDEIGSQIPNIKVTAFLDNVLMRHMDLRYANIDAYLVSKEGLIIRTFMQNHLPIKMLINKDLCVTKKHVKVAKRPLYIGIIGFNALSEEFLLASYENSGIEVKNSTEWGLKAIIFDEDRKVKQAELLQDIPYFRKEEGIIFSKSCPGTEKFYDKLEADAGDFDQLFISLGSTEKNIKMALRLIRMYHRLGNEYKRPQIIIVLHDRANGSIRLLADEKDVFFLQDNVSLYSYEDLVCRRIDNAARILHKQYSKESQVDEKWSQIGTFLQQSNRAVIWDMPNKKAMLDSSELSIMTDEEKEIAYWKMAKYEHRRWNAFHYTHGWTLLPVSELSDEDIAQFKTKHPKEKRHICLVPWDELDDLPQSKPGIIKKFDYDNVKRLFESKE